MKSTALMLLACLLLPSSLAAEDAADSVVAVSCSTPSGTMVGNGCAIGDGSTILTAAHVLFAREAQGEHAAKGMCTVISPFLGEAADAEVEAIDEEKDWALLRVNWGHHPALRMARADEIPSIGVIEIITVRAASTARHDIADAAGSLFRRSDGRIDYLAVAGGKPSFLALHVDDDVEGGWSGAPILLPNAHVVIGCLVETTTEKRVGRVPINQTIATAVAQVVRVDKPADVQHQRAPGAATRPSDAAKSFELFVALLRSRDKSSAQASELLKLRPNNAVAARVAAHARDQAGDVPEAETLYQRALELAPTAQSYIFYAQFLINHNRDADAEKLLQTAWANASTPSAVASLWVPILRKRRDFPQAQTVLQTSLKDDPANAYLWFWLGQVEESQHQPQDAVKAFSTAAQLLPNRAFLEIQLAQTLASLGTFDEAEKHYRAAVDADSGNPICHFALAQFLAKRGTGRRDQAVAEAEAALALPETQQLPRRQIESFIAQLRPETSPSTAPTTGSFRFGL